MPVPKRQVDAALQSRFAQVETRRRIQSVWQRSLDQFPAVAPAVGSFIGPPQTNAAFDPFQNKTALIAFGAPRRPGHGKVALITGKRSVLAGIRREFVQRKGEGLDRAVAQPHLGPANGNAIAGDIIRERIEFAVYETTDGDRLLLGPGKKPLYP